MYGYAVASIVGRITGPAKHGVTNGRAYAFFDVVINKRKYTDQNGNEVEPKPEYLNMVAWGTNAEIVAAHAEKGKLFVGMCNVRPQSETTSIADDGTLNVYRNNVKFEVIGGQFDITDVSDMVYGQVVVSISGRLTKDVVSGKTANRRQYAFFTVAVNKRKRTDANGNKVAVEPDYFKMVAWGTTASIVEKRAQAGVIFACQCEARTQAPQKTMKDGKPVIYKKEMQFVIDSSLFSFMRTKTEDTSNTASAARATGAQQYSPAAPMTDPESDFEDEFEEVESADGTPTMLPVSDSDEASEFEAPTTGTRTYERGETPFLPF